MAKSPDRILAQLYAHAHSRGVKVLDRGYGHFQLQGPYLLVNYYPFSAKRTAYVAGTTEGVPDCDVTKAVAMARNIPKLTGVKAKRSKNSRKIRYRMLQGRTWAQCHWCKARIDLSTSTLDHIIPLGRGGLDNANNRVLACEPCNQRRGHRMPETKLRPTEVKDSKSVKIEV